VPSQSGKGILFVDGLPQSAETPVHTAIKTPVPSRLNPRFSMASRN
jgi:hypothetical protein